MHSKTGTPIANWVQLAPMEGVLDALFRELLSEVGGIDQMVTEFLRVTDRVPPESSIRKIYPEVDRGGYTHSGTPVALQILGGEAEPMAKTAARAVDIGASGIDLNFGCPAKTVNRHDGGAAILQSPDRVYQITRAVRRTVPLTTPVTVKVRLGWQSKTNALAIVQAAVEGGAERLVVHARTKFEMYSRPAHWYVLNWLKPAMQSRLLVANGDIRTIQDYQRCHAVTGIREIALGRGLICDPKLAWKVKGRMPSTQDLIWNHIEFLKIFYTRSLDAYGFCYALMRLKQLMRYWAESSVYWKVSFDGLKTLSDESEIRDWIMSINKGGLCERSKSTPDPGAAIATAPKLY